MYLSARLGKGRIPRWQRRMFYLKLCCIAFRHSKLWMLTLWCMSVTINILKIKHILTTHKYIQKSNTSYSRVLDAWCCWGEAGWGGRLVLLFSMLRFPFHSIFFHVKYNSVCLHTIRLLQFSLWNLCRKSCHWSVAL